VPVVEPDVPDGFVDVDLSSFLDTDPADKTSTSWPDEPVVYEINVTSESPEVDPPSPLAATATTAAARVPDAVKAWIPARLGVSQLWPRMDGEWAEPPAGAQSDNRSLVSVQMPSRRVQSRKPVQDEWGFFDPEQCGFAALLAKLDEIIDVDNGTAVAKPTRGRPRR
jgi:hypothetical protein